MEIFSASLTLCAGNLPVTGGFPSQRPVTRSFDIFFNLCLNKRRRKQSWGWWFETLWRPLWRHCNDISVLAGEEYRLFHTLLAQPYRQAFGCRWAPWWPHEPCYEGSFDVSCVISLNKLLNTQSRCRRFDIPWRSCGVTVIVFFFFCLQTQWPLTSVLAWRQGNRLRSASGNSIRQFVTKMQILQTRSAGNVLNISYGHIFWEI